MQGWEKNHEALQKSNIGTFHLLIFVPFKNNRKF